MGLSAIRVFSVFSGVCGLELGVKLALPASRIVCYVERDPFCQRVIAARIGDGSLDDAPIWDDVATFDGRPWRGSVDLMSGGFPCQDISLAGKRAGIGGKRSGLWGEYARLIGEIRPGYVFVENVANLVTAGLDRVVGDLAALGYDAQWGIVSARAVGASHRRERLFLLADQHRAGLEVGRGERSNALGQCTTTERGGRALADARRGGEHRLQSDGISGRGDTAESRGPRADVADRDEGRCGPHECDIRGWQFDAAGGGAALADAGCCRCAGRAFEPWWEAVRGTAVEGPDPGLPLFPPGPADRDAWVTILERYPELAPARAAQPVVRGVADGPARRMDRLRACGNAVVPLQAAAALVELLRRAEG